ncbi:MAG: ComF family protein [Desulfobacteraceae bacterium]
MIKLLFPPKCLKCHRFIVPVAEGLVPGESLDATFAFFDSKAVETGFSRFFCEECMAQGVVLFELPFCTKCGEKLNTGLDMASLCETCLTSRSRIGRVRAFALYQGVVREGIQLLKYNNKLQLAAFLQLLLFAAFDKHFAGDPVDLILPVPLHRSKLRQRGFNQSFVLIQGFAGIWKRRYHCSPPWKIDSGLLVRKKKTSSQTGFDRVERRENIKNAFQVRAPEKVSKRRIILVDDVYTTGATAEEAAAVLFAAGADSVDVLVLARA